MLPDVEALAGTAEAIPLPDASADAVLVAQAFHWFDPEPACDEIARVLRPGGVLGLVWNLRDGSVPWVADLDRLLDWPADVVARAGELSFEEIERHPAFAVDGRREFPNPVAFTPSRLVDWAASTSHVATGRRPSGRRCSKEWRSSAGRIPICTAGPCSRCPTGRSRSGFPVHRDEPHAVDAAEGLQPFERLRVRVGVDGEHHHRAAAGATGTGARTMRLTLMFEMLTPSAPNSIPTWPIMPGLSSFIITSRCAGASSISTR